jgi:hypothetical protein
VAEPYKRVVYNVPPRTVGRFAHAENSNKAVIFILHCNQSVNVTPCKGTLFSTSTFISFKVIINQGASHF